MSNIDKRYTDIGGILSILFKGNLDVCKILLKIIKLEENKIELFSNTMDQITFLNNEYKYKISNYLRDNVGWPTPRIPLHKYILRKNKNKNKDEWIWT